MKKRTILVTNDDGIHAPGLKALVDVVSSKGKVVVITGAAGLLGWKHSEAVASFGGIPVLIDIDQERLETLTRTLEEQYAVSP